MIRRTKKQSVDQADATDDLNQNFVDRFVEGRLRRADIKRPKGAVERRQSNRPGQADQEPPTLTA